MFFLSAGIFEQQKRITDFRYPFLFAWQSPTLFTKYSGLCLYYFKNSLDRKCDGGFNGKFIAEIGKRILFLY